MLRRLATAALLGLPVVGSGCAVTFMEKLSSDHQESQTPHCDTSKGWVAWDWVNSGLSALVAGGLLAEGARSEDGGAAYIVAGVFAVDSLVHGWSAAKGNDWANECREARREHDSWRTAQRLRAEVDRDYVDRRASVSEEYHSAKDRTSVVYSVNLDRNSDLKVIYRYDGRRPPPDFSPRVFAQVTFERPAWTFRADYEVAIDIDGQSVVPDGVKWNGRVESDGVLEVVQFWLDEELRAAVAEAESAELRVGQYSAALPDEALGRLRAFLRKASGRN